MKPKTLDLDKLRSKDPRIKYGFAKELLKIGSNNPELLYSHLDYWIKIMGSDNNILKWTAIDIIGYISAIDQENKTDKLINNLFLFLHGGRLITCNHAIFSLGLIAKNKPVHRTAIINELIAVSKDTFETEECKNIAIGKVLLALTDFLNDIKNSMEAMEFIMLAKKSTRKATSKKAEVLLKKLIL
jgi:hypothetical protein